jgi:hypothetical protein
MQLILSRGIWDKIQQNEEFGKYVSECFRSVASKSSGKEAFSIATYIWKECPLYTIWLVTDGNRKFTNVMFPHEFSFFFSANNYWKVQE